MDILPSNPPILNKSLAEGTWNMINDKIDKLSLNGNSRVLVAFNMATVFHSINELLDKDKKEFTYDLFYIRYVNGKRIRGHTQKYGNIYDLKKEFNFSLI